MFHEGQRGLIDIGARNVPARREAGLVEHNRPLAIGDDAVAMTDHETAGGLPDVDAMVAVGGMTPDPFVFFVEGVHGWPGKRNPLPQLARVSGQVDVLPRPSWSTLLAHPDGVPGGEPEVR